MNAVIRHVKDLSFGFVAALALLCVLRGFSSSKPQQSSPTLPTKSVESVKVTDQQKEKIIQDLDVSSKQLSAAVALYESTNAASKQNSGSSLSPVSAAGSIEIKPLGTTDETQFLLYCYRKLRGELPWDPKKLNEFRDQVNRYLEYAKDRNIDPVVQSLFKDLLIQIDVTSDFHIQLERIDRGLLAQSEQLSTENTYKAGFAGGYAATSLYQDGAAGSDAALAGIGVSAITFFLEDLQKRKALDESKRRALEVASEDYKRKVSAINARETYRLSDFAVKYSWKKEKDGRWLDSFSLKEMSLFDQYAKSSTPAEALASCSAILEAARLIPASNVFDEHRAYALYFAARAATWTAQQELKGNRWGAVQVPSADLAIRLCDATLRYSSTDPESCFRSQRAWALGIGGRFAEAKALANEVFPHRERDPAFLYNYASLWSCSGSSEKNAFANLKSALSHCSFSSDLDSGKLITVQTVKTDPNLDTFRQVYATEFEELVKLKFGWSIDWGLLSDDICLTNKSAFPITGVKFDVTVKSTRDGTWGPYRYETPRIIPGETFRWKTKIRSRGDDANGSGILTTDQNN